MFLLRGGLGGFFGFASGDLGLQNAILCAAVDLLFANAVETRGVATCFGHDFLFRKREMPWRGALWGKAPSLYQHTKDTRGG